MSHSGPTLVFLGTSRFAVPSLRLLFEDGFHIAAVVTAPDKPAGRGLQPGPSPVKRAALELGLPVLQPERLKDDSFLRHMKSLQPDLMVVVAFRMMPEALWRMPPLGTVNLHASLLPQYRGAAPVNRAIMNGEPVTGVTTFFLKHEVDTGNVLLRKQTEIGADDTAGELHDRLMVLGAGLLLETVQAVTSGKFEEMPQESLVAGEALRQAPRIFNADCRIDWSRPARDVHNQIRGLSPTPGAFAFLKNANSQRVKIFRTRESGRTGIVKPGTIDTDLKTTLRIACGEGWVDVLELQMEGKKTLPVKDFLRGVRMTGSLHFE